ncbi:uncharacterized protein LACBIDRAFT_313234 [Laccaria bicolor S238N-H82]|uniref:Predicted protein n=1 Tax=Laccaria bicolor (strain S238N-H82 / ATCC MYA-4686) TaxID=486041 RepID=B0DXU8_LACBS|nr:uncharacterized protein LACBIDRAFT_313234 [Laccaria bicolor S238N-H82]EDR00526.1 predicted protein [Laccaria bicolor S238N-H82]|eukprot:XP_001888753.1 predicted protein [Laccaria bicolor S238N-H82]
MTSIYFETPQSSKEQESLDEGGKVAERDIDSASMPIARVVPINAKFRRERVDSDETSAENLMKRPLELWASWA